MCSFKLTQSQYAHKAVIETIGDQIEFFRERRLTHISRALPYYAITQGIGYDVHRYITTKLLHFKEYSEEQP